MKDTTVKELCQAARSLLPKNVPLAIIVYPDDSGHVEVMGSAPCEKDVCCFWSMSDLPKIVVDAKRRTSENAKNRFLRASIDVQDVVFPVCDNRITEFKSAGDAYRKSLSDSGS